MSANTPPPQRFNGHTYPQLLPTPDEIRAGDPAPWDVVPTRARVGITLATVEQRLRDASQHLMHHSLPGDPLEMAAVADARAQEITRRSAVLVALYEEAGETHVVLTRRAFHLRHHRGEIALPGGRSDEGEDPIATALRESDEEVGIAPEHVTPVGWLHPIVTFASGSAIWPVVGILSAPPALRPDPIEVDRAFTVPLAELLAEGNFLEERWRRHVERPGSDDEGFFPIYFFRVPEDLVWGATARILTELLCVVTGVAWPDRDRVWA